MEIIPFPHSNLERLRVQCGSKWLQAFARSPVTKADDGQLREKLRFTVKVGTVLQSGISLHRHIVGPSRKL